jgi:hypothetical protein
MPTYSLIDLMEEQDISDQSNDARQQRTLDGDQRHAAVNLRERGRRP